MLYQQVKTSPHGKSISLLIKQKEERAVEEEMRNKQREFSERMENCVVRRNELKKKKEKLEQHIESFRHMLQDSEVRKFRAKQKISSENREMSQRMQEVDTLSQDLSRSVARKCKTTQKIAKYSKVASFMESVYTVAPQGHLDENLPSREAVISRHHTLVNAKKYIEDKSKETIHEMEVLQAMQNAQKISHTNEVMALTTHLANLKSELELLIQRNLSIQEAIDKKMEVYRQKHQNLYMVLNAIDNISESCKKYYDLQSVKVDKSPVESKLKHIQEFCIHWSGIVAHVLHQWNET